MLYSHCFISTSDFKFQAKASPDHKFRFSNGLLHTVGFPSTSSGISTHSAFPPECRSASTVLLFEPDPDPSLGWNNTRTRRTRLLTNRRSSWDCPPHAETLPHGSCIIFNARTLLVRWHVSQPGVCFGLRNLTEGQSDRYTTAIVTTAEYKSWQGRILEGCAICEDIIGTELTQVKQVRVQLFWRKNNPG